MAEIQARIEREARAWLKTPFRHGANVRGAGVDCANLVAEVYRGVGLLDVDMPTYAPDWMMHSGMERLLSGLREHFLPVGEPYQVGDVLTYKYGRAVSHCGIYIGEGQLLHAVSRREVRIDSTSMLTLARRFAGAWRLKALGGGE